MANVLGTLFGEIANAIRTKTGETGKMKPAEFAKKIEAIEANDITLLEDVPIALDLSNGDQIVSVQEGFAVKSAVIAKPETLIPENIANGVNIAGVMGTYSGGGEAVVYFVTFMNGDTELFKMPVLAGDDCKDPISHGDTDTPIKESTVSQVFTYSGWSLTDGGVADASALSAVKSDRTVYAAFTARAREYTINFYDGETLLQSMQVAYGSTPTIAMPEKDGYSFTEWKPAITSVTTDANYYAQWDEKLTFAGGSWADIAAVAEAGEAEQYFAIGDERVEGDFILQIAAFNHDKKTDGTTAGITIIAKASNIRMQANIYGANGGGYGTGGGFGSNVDSTILAKFSEELQTLIKTVVKSYNAPSTTSVSTLRTGNYKVWIPSYKEVTGENLNSLEYPEQQYPLFTDSNNYVLYTTKSLATSTAVWWVRECDNRQANSNAYWYYFNAGTGKSGLSYSSTTYQIRFGFCI